MVKVLKRNGNLVPFDIERIKTALRKAFLSTGINVEESVINQISSEVQIWEGISVEDIQDQIVEILDDWEYPEVSNSYTKYRLQHQFIRDKVKEKLDFIHNYTKSDNTANATIDDNANVNSKNVAIMNAEIHKPDNKEVNIRIWRDKLHELYPEFNYKQMDKDFNTIMYPHDISSQIGMPYCVAITIYPFLTDGIEGIGGLSSAPKNLDSFCGMFINLVFAVASQFKGAVAIPGWILAMDWYCRKEWGDDYYLNKDKTITASFVKRQRTIENQIDQYFQQICYGLMQPSQARGSQACFWNTSIFDKYFYDSMYHDFYYPDATQPQWESFNYLQKHFMHWLNQERLRVILTFPVVSVAMIYKDGHYLDEDMYNFVCQEYSEGNSFFTYVSSTADSLSSCCFSKDTKFLWKASTSGVHCTSFAEYNELPYKNMKENMKVFHNGSWVSGKVVELPNRSMYKVITYNNKEYYMTDNHISVTLSGEKTTEQLTTEDYLLFNTTQLSAVPENNEHLSFAQGFVIGAFLGDGSFGSEIEGTIYDINISQNEIKGKECIKQFKKALKHMGLDNEVRTRPVCNNVLPIRVSCKELVAFIIQWTNWYRGTYAFNKELNLDCLLQSVDFRKGILAGWYNTDGGNSNRCYTTSSKLAEQMEVLITSLGMQSIINISDRTNEKVSIRGEEYSRNYPLYCVRWYEQANHRQNKDKEHSWIKYNNGIYFKIKSIEKVDYNDKVYCVECKNQKEPYFTLPSGLITHNCRLQNQITDNQFSYTNGCIGESTGSKNVITLNISRIVQDFYRENTLLSKSWDAFRNNFKPYLVNILDRVYKYQTAYNEILKDLNKAGLLTVYKAGFISPDRQYLTIGVNALNQGAEFLGIECNNNDNYAEFCHLIFGTIKEQNTLHKTSELMFNTEQTP